MFYDALFCDKYCGLLDLHVLFLPWIVHSSEFQSVCLNQCAVAQKCVPSRTQSEFKSQ